tara:strand:+ start:44 stop:532 length:489 start_codon:yes stop_codon:yes gene_type:complete
MNKYYVYMIKGDSFIKKIASSNNKKDTLDNFKLYLKNKEKKSIDLKENNKCILLKIEKINWDPSKTQPIKIIHGPIKISVNYLIITPRYSLTVNKNEKRNNHLFLTDDFIKKEMKKSNDFPGFKPNDKKKVEKYLKKIVEYSILDKLEKKLLAPKTIDQIKI